MLDVCRVRCAEVVRATSSDDFLCTVSCFFNSLVCTEFIIIYQCKKAISSICSGLFCRFWSVTAKAQSLTVTRGGFRGDGQGSHASTLELGHSKFLERPSGASRMQENLFCGLGSAPDLAGGAYSTPSDPWLAAPPQESHSRFGLLGLWLWPFAPDLK